MTLLLAANAAASTVTFLICFYWLVDRWRTGRAPIDDTYFRRNT